MRKTTRENNMKEADPDTGIETYRKITPSGDTVHGLPEVSDDLLLEQST